uniref:Potassium channel domain-containing protein n=1 Tax=Araucaria cunninghamii TaxID=56994 RepID=A0A0D6QRI6_ARACU
MNEPLLPAYVQSPRLRAPDNLLFSLPEDEQVDRPLTTSNSSSAINVGALKERLIFGSSVDAEPLLRSPSFAGIRTSENVDIEGLAEAKGEEASFTFERDSGRWPVENIDPSEREREHPFVVDLSDGGINNRLQSNEQSWNFNAGRRRNLHRSRTAPAMSNIGNVRENLKRPELDSASSIVKQAFVYLMLYLVVGVFIYSFNKDKFSGNETHAIVDALYFCIVTMCTIGYGDITPMTTSTKLFACLFVLVGFGFIDILLGGMVTYVLDKQENLLLTTVEGSHHDIAKTYIVDVKKGRMRIRMKVALALGVVILCIGVGTLVMHFAEDLGWTDAFYLSVMSVTTVGYGDHAFNTLTGRLFASIWLLVSTLAVARAFLYFAEARIDKRHRLIAKWVLHRDMTIQDLLAADIDNNGFVSKSEYVIYKLKELGKVEEKDILEIVKQFNRLDPDNSGKITLSLLSAGH